MLHSRKTSIYRFNHELPLYLPLAVRSTGEYWLAPGSPELEPPMSKYFAGVFWSEEGVGEFELEKRWVRVQNCELFYLLPGEVQHIRPVSRLWKYHWFTLDHPQAPQWMESLGLVHRPLPARHCPRTLFRKLADCVSLGSVAGDRQASHIAHALLLAAAEESLTPKSRSDSWVEVCRKHIDDNFTNPNLNIADVAHVTGVHRATLFRAFKQTHQMTPSHYLQNRRLHHALELLKQTNLPIKEVAHAAGLLDANYLARRVRRLTGIPPQTLRERYRLQRMPNV